MVPGGKASVPELNDFKKDSIGYLTLLKEFPLGEARKLLFLSESHSLLAKKQWALIRA